jgi:4-hydroxybenzoate polyprenyltransferase
MRLKSIGDLIVLPNTLFAMPWLVAGLCLVFKDPLLQARPLSLSLLFWMVLAFISARIAGMSFNRIIDVEWDAKNPRTQGRVLVTGQVSREQVSCLAWGSIGLFIVCCSRINLTCLALAPLAVGLLWGYSYLKRVTRWYHLVMALNHAMLPLFVWAALTGSISIPALYLAGALLSLICANDIIYGIQDVDFDRHYSLHSMATAMGPLSSLWIARGLHVLFVALLIDVGVLLGLREVFYIGITTIASLLVYFNVGLDITDGRSINTFMFRCNTWVGFVLMMTSVASVV